MNNTAYHGSPTALVAIMHNRADFARAAGEHWYRIEENILSLGGLREPPYETVERLGLRWH